MSNLYHVSSELLSALQLKILHILVLIRVIHHQKRGMISHYIPVTNGTCRSTHRQLLLGPQNISTLQDSTHKDLKTTVGKSPPMVFRATVVIRLITPAVTTHTKSMSGTRQVFQRDSTGSVLQFAIILGCEYPMPQALLSIGYSNHIHLLIHGAFKLLQILVLEM